MWASSRMTKLMALATTSTKMVAISEVSGKMTSSMERGSKGGLTARCSKETTLMVQSKAMVLTPGATETSTRATSNRTA